MFLFVGAVLWIHLAVSVNPLPPHVLFQDSVTVGRRRQASGASRGGGGGDVLTSFKVWRPSLTKRSVSSPC